MLHLTSAKRDWPALELLSLLTFSLFVSCSVYGQVVGTTLSGTVRDTSGAIVPQARISIKNVGTDISSVVVTNGVGFYTAPNLLPGNYEITASAAGFGTSVQTGITLSVGAEQVLNFNLRVGR